MNKDFAIKNNEVDKNTKKTILYPKKATKKRFDSFEEEEES